MLRTTGWAVGVAAMFVALLVGASPARGQWVQQRMSPSGTWGQDDTIMAVGAISDQRVIAFGAESDGQGGAAPRLYRTSNGGSSWSGVATDGGDFFSMKLYLDFAFADPQVGYTIEQGLFSGPKVAKTVDAGAQWAEQNIAGMNGSPMTLWALSAERVFLAGTDGLVGRTTNGLAWQVQNVAGAEDADFSAIFFLNEHNGWAVGGKTDPITQQDRNGNEVVVGYDVLPKGVVARSRDGGATWQTLVSGEDAVFDSVAFTTDSRGLLTGHDNRGPFVWATSNGGEAWQPVTLPPGPDGLEYFHLGRVRCPDPFHCWVMGGAGRENGGPTNRPVFLFTTNAGLSWALQTVDEGIDMVLDAAFVGPHRGWAVGTFGQIWRWDDPTQAPDPVDPTDPTDPGDDPSVPGPWDGILGEFEDGQVPPVGGAPADPGDGGNGGSGGDGGMWIGDGDGDEGLPICGSGSDGCSKGQEGRAPWVLLLLVVGFLLAVRKARVAGAAGLALVLVLAVACAEDEDGDCVPPNGAPADVTSPGGQDDVVGSDDVTTPEPPLAGAFCEDFLDSPAPALSGRQDGGEGREIGGERRIVVALAAPAGGSDLWLIDPANGAKAQLTFFDDPEIDVWDPAFSPDRRQVAFVSNFGAERNALESNLFIVGADGSGCRQVTPAPGAGRIARDDAPVATVQGILRRARGGMLAEPVEGALVRSSLGGATTLTNRDGGFFLEVPAGQGTLFFRHHIEDELNEAARDYDFAPDEEADLGIVLCAEQGESARLRAPSWRPDGAGLTLRNETRFETRMGVRTRTLLQSIAVDGAGLEVLAAAEDDRLGVPAYHPHEEILLVGLPGPRGSDDRLAFTDPGAPDEAEREMTLPGYHRGARPAMSAHRFLAVAVDEDGAREVMVVGADERGRLETHIMTSFGDALLRPDGLDWAPDGRFIALLRDDGAGGGDLHLLELATGATRALLDDGSVLGFAWYGR